MVVVLEVAGGWAALDRETEGAVCRWISRTDNQSRDREQIAKQREDRLGILPNLTAAGDFSGSVRRRRAVVLEAKEDRRVERQKWKLVLGEPAVPISSNGCADNV